VQAQARRWLDLERCVVVVTQPARQAPDGATAGNQ